MTHTPSSAPRALQSSLRQAATLALLASLAACGGGETPTADDAPSAGLSTKAADAAAGGDAQGAANAAAQNTAAAAPAPVTADNVRGDVLATALRTSYSDTSGGFAWPVPLESWSGQPPEGKSAGKDMVAGVEQEVLDKAGTNGVGPFAWKANTFSWTMNGVRQPNPIATDTVEFGLSAYGLLPASTANEAADAEVLQITPTAALQTILPDEGNAGAARAEMLTISTTTTIRRLTQYRLDPNQYLHSWYFSSEGRDDAAPELGLFLKKGYASSQFQVCWRVQDARMDMNRTGCTIWEVPTGWAPGKSLKRVGQYLMDSTRKNDNTGQWVNRHFHTSYVTP